jgi:oligopeptide transport system ATP-binding protein
VTDLELEIKNLRISFHTNDGKVQAVRGINLYLNKGETLAIVGESGSGKSVTAKSIMGLLPPNGIVEDGQILYNGENVLKYSEQQYDLIRGRTISMISQDPLSSLDPIMKIGNQMTEVMLLSNGRRRYHTEKVTRRAAFRKAAELLKSVGITDPQNRLKQYPFEFSGGMRQRIVIAIAIASNPEILICDEPTTALDVTIQAQILDLIKTIKTERNMSVIFITHDLGVVAHMADRVAVMYAGKIVEEGTAEDIFYRPAHPYTWALLSSMPDLATHEKLEAIPGSPPNMIFPPKGDAFAGRNRYAMQIDFEREPPLFRITDTHAAATWLLHPQAPKVELPAAVRERIERMKAREERTND